MMKAFTIFASLVAVTQATCLDAINQLNPEWGALFTGDSRTTAERTDVDYTYFVPVQTNLTMVTSDSTLAGRAVALSIVKSAFTGLSGRLSWALETTLTEQGPGVNRLGAGIGQRLFAKAVPNAEIITSGTQVGGYDPSMAMPCSGSPGRILGYRVIENNVPSSSAPPLLPPPTIVSLLTAFAAGDATLDLALNLYGKERLNGYQSHTFFIPSPEALTTGIARLQANNVVLNPTVVSNLLNYHILPQLYASYELAVESNPQDRATLLRDNSLSFAGTTPSTLTIKASGNENTTTVVMADISFDAGFIHIVSDLLIPDVDLATFGTTPTSTPTPTSAADMAYPNTITALLSALLLLF